MRSLSTSIVVFFSMAAGMCNAQSVAATKPRPVVLAYIPAWRDAIADPATFDFGTITHVCRAFLRPRADGTLFQEPGFFNPTLETAARSHGVKLLMSIGGESHDPKRWLSMARSPEATKTFLNGLAELYSEHQYDGVDIDWEPPPATVADGKLYLSLLEAIRARFPQKLLTVALSPKEYAVHFLPLPEVLATIDYFNAMTYDYSGPWTGVATFSANLHPDAAGAHTSSSVDDAMHNLLEVHHVPPAKVVMGLTFWGYRFRVDHLGDPFPKRVANMADNIELARIADLLETGRYTAGRDDVADAAYVVRNGGGCVITYEDEKSIEDKCHAALRLGCAGVMMWHGGADAGSGTYPLMNAISRSFGLAPADISRAALLGEVARLSGRPVSDAMSTEELLRIDARLRKTRGETDDQHWMNSKPIRPATQPAVAR